MNRQTLNSARQSLLFSMFIVLILAVPLAAELAAQDQAPAGPVGGQLCAECHADQADQFARSVHSRLAAFELYGRTEGCEACHGPGSRHAESLEADDIFTFEREGVAEMERICLSCHADRVGYHWKRSEHGMNGVSCTECHKIHQSRSPAPVTRGVLEKPVPAFLRQVNPPPRASLAKPEPELCLECHQNIKGKLMMPSRHPVAEGKMSCTSCHDTHGSDVAGLRTVERSNDLCLQCHTAKQGPFVFDHQPVSEDCATCHVPHGSVTNNLLKQNEPFLCLQCHEAHFHIGRSGLSTAVNLPSGSSQNPFGESGFRRAYGTKCTQCHVRIHGTDLPSQSVPGRGKALIR